MPRKAKKQAPQAEASKSYDEFVDDDEAVDDDSIPAEEESHASLKSRDWRDVEKLQEERRLRNLIADDLDFDLDDRKRRN
ncbi:PA3496 family putative envelope integrity protein [Solimonas terrae]|uniref:Uncharacterized protein n=1 Tax=Solimonas terrae TaxID=1396819 RepID=A0A6M2BQJ0_9GAMM|nr:hypothetical protein [Solimonas terrae]NGY04475.1 hypothetical protein [Solimonas terrae]